MRSNIVLGVWQFFAIETKREEKNREIKYYKFIVIKIKYPKTFTLFTSGNTYYYTSDAL